jgi:hypothetical protein
MPANSPTHLDRQAALGCGLMRDGNGPRALETLLRYRGSVLADCFARSRPSSSRKPTLA